jgi:hypothetical protein
VVAAAALTLGKDLVSHYELDLFTNGPVTIKDGASNSTLAEKQASTPERNVVPAAVPCCLGYCHFLLTLISWV